VLFVSLRDLQWRRRRFLIGVFATGLVFALAIVITGISQSFINETSRTVNVFDADAWVLSEKSTGPFTSSTLIPVSLADELRATPGVEAVGPIAVTRFTIETDKLRDTGVIGVEPGSAAMPKVSDGRPIERDGEVVADSSFGSSIGDEIEIGGSPFTIVGRTKGVSYYAGTPALFVTLRDAQRLAFAGQPLVTAFVVRGNVAAAPAGTHVLTNAQTIADLKRPLESASGTVEILSILMWIVAAGIIGSILYVQAIERTRDFAVFKATGVTGRTIASGLAFQAVVLALLSAVVAIVLAALLAPTMPMAVEVPGSAYAQLVIVAVVIGVLASLFGLRRAVSVDPALAFGGG
jgi:putative ABC transport system permease protein